MSEILLDIFIKNKENLTKEKKRTAYGKSAAIWGLIFNAFLFVIKIVTGIVSSSVSIVADAVNNLSDASSTLISLFGFKLSEKPADKEHPYGHGRYEYLSALGVSVVIIVIGIELLKTSLNRIINPSMVKFSVPLFIILLVSIAIKFFMMIFYKDVGGKISSNALNAASVDSRNDVISTASVLLAAVISKYTGYDLDGWVGLVVAVFILVSGFGLIRQSLDPMLGTVPDKEYVDMIKEKMFSYEGVLGMHDLIIHDYGPMRKFASVHIEMAAEEDPIKSHDTIDNIENDFLKECGLFMIIHYDPVLTKNPLTQEMKTYIEAVVKKVNDQLSIHDLRVVPGTTHTNIVFDCLASFDLKMKDDEIKQEIIRIVKEENPSYNCVITVDRSFC